MGRTSRMGSSPHRQPRRSAAESVGDRACRAAWLMMQPMRDRTTVADRHEVAGVSLSWAAMSDVGKVRALNEDALLVDPPVFLVADGMGGHDAGEVASALTVERFRNLVG